MNVRILVLVLVLLAFGALTGAALLELGMMGVFAHQFANWGGIQVFVDLILAAGLVAIWMIRDARERKASVWPYLLITAIAGSFGPLLYLLNREVKNRE